MIGRGIGIPFRHGTGGGVSIPPEIKKSIVAWYNPKKQKLTNYDVIESYAEDFTASKWVTVQNRAVFTKTASKIHITESMSDGLNTTFIETSQSRYGNEMKINVSGIVAGGVTLKYRYGSYKEVVDITSNGVYTLPAGKAGTNPNGYNGFVMKAKGKCDITITQLPTSILKDFSGNKHDAYLYGFKGKLNSGVGIYKVDFSKLINNAFDNFERFNNKFIAKGTYKGNYEVFGQYTVDGIVKNKVTIKITGVSNLSNKLILQYGYITKDIKYIQKEITVSKDGIYSYDLNDVEIPDENNIAQTIYNRLFFGANVINDINLIVEEIPDYPNQLCYDGKSYAVAYGFPILTDYTVIAERTWFEIGNNSCFASKRIGANKGAFAIEYRKLYAENFGSYNAITFVANKKEIIVQSKEKYNDKDLIAGNEIDTNQLLIGGISLNNNRLNEPYIGCHGAIIIADRSFTEEEINWLKQNWDKI